MTVKPGERVGAILKMDQETCHLLGYGVFDGYKEAPFGPMGMSLDEYKEVHKEVTGEDNPPPFENPRITLDDNTVVWGCECWWGSEESIKKKIGDRKIIEVKPRSANT